MKNLPRILAAGMLAAGIAWPAAAGFQDEQPAAIRAAQTEAPAGDQAVIAKQLPSYPLTTCPLSGEELDESAVDKVVDGRLVRLCCKRCAAAVEKDSSKAIAAIDAAVVEAQKKIYPLKTCVISGHELGSMGEPVDHVHGTRLLRFCCDGCVKPFEREADKHMATVDAALVEQLAKKYPLSTCPMSGEELGDAPVDRLHGVTLVRFCCKRCAGAFDKDPQKHMPKVKAAMAEARKAAREPKQAGENAKSGDGGR